MVKCFWLTQTVVSELVANCDQFVTHIKTTMKKEELTFPDEVVINEIFTLEGRK